jgi:hypothetical protein
MATNPDSIERDPTPIQQVIKRVKSTSSLYGRTLLLATIAGIISTAQDPLGLFGCALVVAYAATEARR